MKKLITSMAALSLAMAMMVPMVPAHAIEIDESNYTPEITTAVKDMTSMFLPGAATMTRTELAQLFINEGVIDNDLGMSGNSIVTVNDALQFFVSAFQSRFINYDGFRFYYPMEDSTFLRAEEWAAIIEHLMDPVPREVVQLLIDRAEESAYYIKRHHIPDTVERYEDMIDNFYPEFSSLLDDNAAGLKYWIDSDRKYGCFEPASIYSIPHELAHEQSARMVNAFHSRNRVSQNIFAVMWSHTPQTVPYYNIETGEFQSITRKNVPVSSYMLSDAPDAVKATEYYKTYCGSSAGANKNGIYGMLEEFASMAINLRMTAISSSIDYHVDAKVNPEEVSSFFWWQGAILHYMDKLETQKPELYQEILEDESFMSLLRDVYKNANEQFDYMRLDKVTEDGTPTSFTLIPWATDEACVKQAEKLGIQLEMVPMKTATFYYDY